jgi:glycosyltransferase involved in cell wall biosynthesis
MQHRYAEANCLLFPSRLETWGLPITEAKQNDLPLFVADLAYAHETVGDYKQADFIDVDDHVELANKLLAFQEGRFQFPGGRVTVPSPPFVSGWVDLVKLLTCEIG